MKWAGIKRMVLLIPVVMAGMLVHAVPAYHFEPIDRRFDSIARHLLSIDFANERHAVDPRMLAQLNRIADNSGDSQLKARAIYWQVRMSQMSARPAECISRLEEAMRLCRPGYGYDRGLISYQLAGNYERLGKYTQCYNFATEAISAFREAGDDYFLGNTHLLLVQLFHDIGDLESARRQLAESKACYTRAGYPLNRIYFFEGLFCTDDTKSLGFYRRSVVAGGKDWGMTVQALLNISAIQLRREQPDSAALQVEQARILLSRNAPENTFFTSLLANQTAQILYQQDRYDEAMAQLRSVEHMTEQLHGETFMLDTYRLLWLISEKRGRMTDAYQYLKTYQEAFEHRQEEIRKLEGPKAEARQAIARQADRIRLLEQDAELNRNYFYLTLLISALVLLICGVVVMYFYNRYRLRRVENMQLRQSLEQEAIIYQMNMKNFQEDIKQKDCEISSSTLLLTNKNEVLRQLHDITKRYSDDGRIPQEYVRQVNEAIGDSLRNDDEWSRFKLHFTSVHPDFFVKLKARCSELTENDLRLCAYISIGMRAKQIAEMLSISPDSVNSNRYRLRKKLGLEHGDSLDDFIRNI